MTIKLVSSAWVISIAKARTNDFFHGKPQPFYRRNNTTPLIEVPFVLPSSKNVLTIFVEPTDFLLQFVLGYIKEAFCTKKQWEFVFLKKSWLRSSMD